MKLKLAIILGATASLASAATTVTVRNFADATNGLPIIDNTGAVFPLGELSWAVGSFESGFAAGLGALDTLSSDDSVISAFTQSGPSGAFNFDGIFSRSVAVDDGGALGAASAPLDVLVTHSPAGGNPNAMVLDFTRVFPAQVAGNASTGTLTVALENVLYGGQALMPLTSKGNIPGPFNYANGITFDAGTAVPEPSTSLLAGLAGLALAARRRR